MVAEKYTGDRLPFVAVYVVLFDDLAIGIIQAWQDDDARGLDMALVGEFQGHGIGPTTAHALARRLTSDGSGGTCPPIRGGPMRAPSGPGRRQVS